jgi:hypothetical protein
MCRLDRRPRLHAYGRASVTSIGPLDRVTGVRVVTDCQLGDLSPLFGAALVVAYPVYLLLMAGAVRVCGVSEEEIAKRVLRQANRQRLTDLIRAARGLPAEPGDKIEPPPGAAS